MESFQPSFLLRISRQKDSFPERLARGHFSSQRHCPLNRTIRFGNFTSLYWRRSQRSSRPETDRWKPWYSADLYRKEGSFNGGGKTFHDISIGCRARTQRRIDL